MLARPPQWCSTCRIATCFVKINAAGQADHVPCPKCWLDLLNGVIGLRDESGTLLEDWHTNDRKGIRIAQRSIIHCYKDRVDLTIAIKAAELGHPGVDHLLHD